MKRSELLHPELLRALSKITPEEEALLQGDPLQRESYSSSTDFVVEHRKMIDVGKLIAVRPHTRFVSFPQHRHDYIEMMYVCSGSVTHRMQGGKMVRVNAGELLLLNPMAQHAILAANERDVAVNFLILPQFLEETFRSLPPDSKMGCFLRACLHDGKDDIHYLHFHISESLPVQNLLENLIWSLLHQEENRDQIHRMTMGTIFLHLQNELERQEQSQSHKEQHPLLLAAYHEIRENFADADFTALADRLGVSVSYYSQTVKRLTGKTFKTLLWEFRVQKAKELLLQSRLSVDEIIHFVGYENTAYFFRMFRRDVGVSPKEYREMRGIITQKRNPCGKLV